MHVQSRVKTMRINRDNFAIYIVTYDRPQSLNSSIRGYLETIPFTPKINVISNHSRCVIDAELQKYVTVTYNNMRPDESWGYLTRSWNQCFQFGFVHHEWILCSQDDVIVKPGWFELVNSTGYDFYLAPLGDTRFLLNRSAFRRIGWFDERFVGIGWHEHDYIMRVLNLLPETASIVDDHYYQPIKHNSIGLEQYWIQPDLEQDEKVSKRGGEISNFEALLPRISYYQSKWGVLPCHKMVGIPVSELPREIDWYPYISGKYSFLRITNPQYSFDERQKIRAKKQLTRLSSVSGGELISLPAVDTLAGLLYKLIRWTGNSRMLRWLFK